MIEVNSILIPVGVALFFANIFGKIFLQICRASQSSILRHLQNLQPLQYVPLTPTSLHFSVCST